MKMEDPKFLCQQEVLIKLKLATELIFTKIRQPAIIENENENENETESENEELEIAAPSGPNLDPLLITSTIKIK